jgi:hypothetical protein
MAAKIWLLVIEPALCADAAAGTKSVTSSSASSRGDERKHVIDA